MKKKRIVFWTLLVSLACCPAISAQEGGNVDTEAAAQEETDSAEEKKEQAPAPIERSLGLTTVLNARELGGYEGAGGLIVGGGRLWRSGDLSQISAEDKELLHKKGLATIIDLRTSWEATAAPDGKLGGVRNRLVEKYLTKRMEGDFENYFPYSPGMKYQTQSLNLLGAMGQDAEEFFEQKYTQAYLFDDTALAGYRRIFDLLATSRYPILIHSWLGKDRTGFVCALILSVLGVDRETVLEDYVLSNDYLLEYIQEELTKAQEETGSTDSLDQIFTVCSVERSWLENAFDIIEQDYGSMENFYRQALDLTDEKIAELRARFLKDPNAPDVTPEPTVTQAPEEDAEKEDSEEENQEEEQEQYGDTVSDLYEDYLSQPEYYETPVYTEPSVDTSVAVVPEQPDTPENYGDMGGYTEVPPPDAPVPW